MQRGKFIVLEGVDGSGKSTQARMLAEELRARGVDCLLTAEHTRVGVGRLIEKTVRGKLDLGAVALQFCFVADRVEHSRTVIEPALKQGRWVVCDRYWGSTVAYGDSNLGRQFWLRVNKRIGIEPDLTFLVKVGVKTAIARMSGRGRGRTVFEKKKKLGQVNKVYDWLAKRFKRSWVKVDGERSRAVINKEMMAEIRKRGWL